MNDYTHIKCSLDEIRDLKKIYIEQLRSPLDGMWQSFIDMATQYSLLNNGQAIGYFIINDESKLLQFYVSDTHLYESAFAYILGVLAVKGAVVSTFEDHFLSCCMDHQKSVGVNALLYQLGDEEKETTEHQPLTLVTKDEIEEAVQFGRLAIFDNEEWLRGYYKERIDRKELYGLWQGNRFIAAGECRLSDAQIGFADVGMAVMPECRTKGIATGILMQLICISIGKNLKPICSTEAGNVAAQKAISRAGFISKNRILDVTF